MTFTSNLLHKLQRRFPTTQHSSTSTSNSRSRSQRVGRQSNESEIKDIVIVGLQCEKRQQHANRRSVSNVELTLLVGLHLKRLE